MTTIHIILIFAGIALVVAIAAWRFIAKQQEVVEDFDQHLMAMRPGDEIELPPGAQVEFFPKKCPRCGQDLSSEEIVEVEGSSPPAPADQPQRESHDRTKTTD